MSETDRLKSVKMQKRPFSPYDKMPWLEEAA